MKKIIIIAVICLLVGGFVGYVVGSKSFGNLSFETQNVTHGKCVKKVQKDGGNTFDCSNLNCGGLPNENTCGMEYNCCSRVQG